MDISVQRQKAESFRRMHHGNSILVLPNAWDGASARIFESAGFRAIATTSAGVAYLFGYPDGEVISRDMMVAGVGWIARSVEVPVTADMESGYGKDARSVADTVRAVINEGVIGINLEDAIHPGGNQLYEPADAIERICAAREAANSSGVPIVINARTDVFLHRIGDESQRLEHAIARANAYREAGADCLFVPGVRDAETVAALVREINGPLNIMAGAGTPPVSELARIGVARVSVGPGPAHVAMTATRKLAENLLRDGTFDAFGGDAITYPQANALMARRRA